MHVRALPSKNIPLGRLAKDKLPRGVNAWTDGPHAQCSWDRLGIHHDPAQDKTHIEDEMAGEKKNE